MESICCAYRARYTPQNMRRSVCCRWSPAAIVATSAGCRQRWVRYRDCRRFSSMTGTPAGPASPTAASARSTRGGRRPQRRSRPANAQLAVRHVCNRRSVAAAMIRSTRRVRYGCCVWCSARSRVTRRDPPTGRPTPRRSPPGSAAKAVLKTSTPSTQTGAANGRTTRSVPNPGSRAQTKNTLSEGSLQLRDALPNARRSRLAAQIYGFRRRLRRGGGC